MKGALLVLVISLIALSNAATLRNLIGQRFIGSCAAASYLQQDAKYSSILGEQFNIVTAENEMKMAATQPSRGQFSFSQGDAILNYAIQHNQTVRGHTFVWGQYNPSWFANGNFNSAQLQQILKDHIGNVSAHYKGKLYSWDVVNEAVSDSPSGSNYLKQTVWSPLSNYIDLAFQYARDADPSAKLFYNDYSAEGMSAKANAVYDLVKGMKNRGIPIDGVGLQCHFTSSYAPSFADITANINRLVALGLEVHITEFDYGITGTSQESQQGTFYQNLLNVCLQIPNCKSFQSWGFTDKYTWLGSDKLPLEYDTNYNIKPAYSGLLKALGG